jgi:hypothetical protein
MACTHPRWRDDDTDGVQSICCAVCGMDSHDAQRALLAEPAWEEPEPEPDGVFVMAAPLWWTPNGVEPDRDVLETEAMLACPAYGPMGVGQCQSGCWTEPRCQVDEPLEGWETGLVLVVPPMVVRPVEPLPAPTEAMRWPCLTCNGLGFLPELPPVNGRTPSCQRCAGHGWVTDPQPAPVVDLMKALRESVDRATGKTP